MQLPFEAHRAFRGRHGFTIIELMVLLVILGIAAALVVPHIASSSTFEAQGAARAIMADLYTAQNGAISEQVVRKVIFDVANDRYSVTDATDTPLAASWLGGAYTVDFGAQSSFKGVSISAADFGGSTTVSFDELGTPSSGGTIDIRAGGLTYRITVTAFTGRVTVDQVVSGG